MLVEMNHLVAMFKDRTLFHIDHLTIQPDDRIGLIGKNGSGKTTLLEILDGEWDLTSGTVKRYGTTTLLPQLKMVDSAKSGGEVTQTYIDQCLASEPVLFLADEPTTNLDTMHVGKLENDLKRWKGAFVIVSHDRAFLDALCTTIWEVVDGGVHVCPGNYTDFLEQKEIARQTHERQYERYINKKKQLEEALQKKELKAQRATKKPKNISSSEARIKGARPYFAKKQKKLHQTRSAIETRIGQLEKVEKPQALPEIKMDITNADILKGRRILQMNDVTGMVADRLLWQTRHIDVRNGEKIAVIGDNGSGKTTMLKQIIAQSDGISLSPAVKVGYFDQHIDLLDLGETILENVMEDAIQSEGLARTVLARLHFFGSDVYKKVRVLSGGERVKVAFAKIFISDVNMLIMDEPTNFLDIASVEALEELLQMYEGTVLFASHDRRFIDHIATRLFIIENKEVRVFDGTYEEYQVRRQSRVDSVEERLFVIENRIAEVIGKLSLEPTEELEAEFDALLEKKEELR